MTEQKKLITGQLAWDIACRNIYTTPSKKALLATLVFNVNHKTGSFFKSLNDLHLESGCSEGFIKNTLAYWRSIGLLTWKTGDPRKGESNTYTLSLAVLQKQAEKCKAAGSYYRESAKEKSRARFKRWYDKQKVQTASGDVRANGTKALEQTAQSNVQTASEALDKRLLETCHETFSGDLIHETSCGLRPQASSVDAGIEKTLGSVHIEPHPTPVALTPSPTAWSDGAEALYEAEVAHV